MYFDFDFVDLMYLNSTLRDCSELVSITFLLPILVVVLGVDLRLRYQ